MIARQRGVAASWHEHARKQKRTQQRVAARAAHRAARKHITART